jgi:LEA14-like dessication related protein
MIRRRLSRAVGLMLLSGCTPLGLWLYDDPVVTVSRISLESGKSRRPGSTPVIVALAVQNVNDYPLSTERLELALRLDGVAIGTLRRDSTVAVAHDTISVVAVTLPVEKQAISAHLQALGPGTHTFAVQGRATFRTPIGTRKVSFTQAGAMVFGERRGGSSR